MDLQEIKIILEKIQGQVDDLHVALMGDLNDPKRLGVRLRLDRVEASIKHIGRGIWLIAATVLGMVVKVLI